MILDTFLNENAKAFAGESFVTPAYVAVGTGTAAITSTSTALSGEVGDARGALSLSRTANVIEFSGIRSGTGVNTSSGEYLNEIGIFSAVTSGIMLSAITIPSILQTTTFDIDISGSFTWSRT